VNGSPVQRFDVGGVVSRESLFRMGNGRVGSLAEGDKPGGILPLQRDSQGRLGVINAGGKGGGDIHITVNMSGNGADKRTGQQLARAVAREVLLARRG
jgi:hypothetical protein